MDQFPPNSRSGPREPDEPPKKIERVTSGEAVRRKRGLGRQFKETFIGGDAKSAFHYMMLEVVVPAIQDTLIDAFQGGVERLIRGERARPRRGGAPIGYGTVDYKPYHRMGQPSREASVPRAMSRSARARHDFADILIQSRQEAEEVLERLYDVLSQYGSVSVAQLYELTGIESSHTDMKWGWRELRGSRVARTRAGAFLLDLPDPEPLG